MVKKITALTLLLTMLLSTAAFGASFSDVPREGEYSEAIEILTSLRVLSGMGDGTFSPNSSLTRAQFAKIAVCMMGKTKEAVVTTDAFSDVKSSDWYSGYVNVVANEGIITGYPDGRFGADEAITYAQAVTVLVRLLGYNADDVGHRWPRGYMEKAAVLGITEGVSFDNNNAVPRSVAALFIYRTLFTDMKGTDTALVTKLQFNVYEDAVVIATSKQNTQLTANQVQTDKGTFTANIKFDEYLGCKGTAVSNDDGEIVVFVPSEDIEKSEYTVSSVYTSSESVNIITEEAGTIVLPNKTAVYMDGASLFASNIAEGINAGSKIALFKEKGTLQYVFVEEYKYEGPKVVYSVATKDNLFNIKDKASLKVIRKGLSSSLDEIELYDVLYYSERTNTIYAYCDRVTGVYEKAFPMKSNVSKVTVSGSEYSLSTPEAVNKLSENPGAFNIGDRVTLLLGENGDVVDAVSLTGADLSLYGVITKTGTRISEDEDTLGRTENYVTIMGTDGTEKTYAVSTDNYEDKAGQFCEINFAASYAVLSFPTYTSKTGTVDKDNKTLGDYPFASNYAIMEYEDGNRAEARVSVLSIADVDGLKLSKNNIKHVQLNAKGEIVVLYLNNVSGNRNIYGILTSVPENKTGTYTVLSGNKTYSKNATYTSLSKGDAVAYYAGVDDTEITAMTKVAEGRAITSYTDNIIKMNSAAYTLSDDVTVYAGRTVAELKTVTLDDALLLTGSITFYSDRSAKDGGKIRVIRIITA